MKMMDYNLLKMLFKTIDNVVTTGGLEDDLVLFSMSYSSLDLIQKSDTQVHFLKNGTVEVHVGEDHEVRGRFTMAEVLDLTTAMWTDLNPEFRSMIFEWSTSLTLTGSMM
jgi:hypothetical protein